jgi:dolichyl-phosphate beta-glucosyltransferase
MLIRKKNHRFSVVLPLYKPKGNWAKLFIQNVNELNSILPQDVTLQYVVVHDGPVSRETDEIFEQLLRQFNNISFISYEHNKGKGHALREGVKNANTDYVLMTDFDFPYKKKNIVELMQLLIDGHDVVVGKRSPSYFRQLPFKRKIISGFCILLKKLFLDLPVHDTQSGIKAFNRNGKKIFLQTTIDRFLIDTEFILLSYKSKLSIKELNIDLEPYVEFSNFGLQVIKTELSNFVKLLYLNKQLRKYPAS